MTRLNRHKVRGKWYWRVFVGASVIALGARGYATLPACNRAAERAYRTLQSILGEAKG